MGDPQREYETPTFDQIVAFASVHLYGAAGLFPAQIKRTRTLLEADDDWRKEWYRRHYETQRDVWQRGRRGTEKGQRMTPHPNPQSLTSRRSGGVMALSDEGKLTDG